MGRLLDKLKHTCPKCRVIGFPTRIMGTYANHSRSKVYLWECDSCDHIWKDTQKHPKPVENKKEHAVLRLEHWKTVAEKELDL